MDATPCSDQAPYGPAVEETRYGLTIWLHPACAAMPPMSSAAFGGLTDDICKNGMQLPVLLTEYGGHDNVIVDGRNRAFAAALLASRAEYKLASIHDLQMHGLVKTEHVDADKVTPQLEIHATAIRIANLKNEPLLDSQPPVSGKSVGYFVSGPWRTCAARSSLTHLRRSVVPDGSCSCVRLPNRIGKALNVGFAGSLGNGQQ